MIQEIRAKKLLDQIRILTTTKVNAYRDDAWIEISVDEIVQDDVLGLQAGIQIPVSYTHLDVYKRQLQHSEHVLLAGKGHLHVQLVELAGGTVAPGVLVPETGGDLEILVKAGGHQQLLELLGSLGQGVELAGMLPGGHQVVPGALGGGGGEDGGGDLQKALVLHGTAQGGHHLAAHHDVLFHLGVAQVQIAVFQPGVLAGVFGVVHLKGQLAIAAAAQHLSLIPIWGTAWAHRCVPAGSPRWYGSSLPVGATPGRGRRSPLFHI